MGQAITLFQFTGLKIGRNISRKNRFELKFTFIAFIFTSFILEKCLQSLIATFCFKITVEEYPRFRQAASTHLQLFHFLHFSGFGAPKKEKMGGGYGL